jgi:L-ascorbate metabolism protein UlaG (beta-lactamase superfamily)
LFKMKFAASPYEYIRERLRIDQDSNELFSSFFTEEEPRRYDGYAGDAVRIRYFGHACILIEWQGHSILTDPVISYKDDLNHGQYTYADLPQEIDHVLITHGHQDHIIFEPSLQLRHKVKNFIVPRSSGVSVADPSLKLLMKTVGFKNVWEIDELETIEIPGGRIVSLPFLGEHSDLNIRTKTTYLIEIQGKRALLLADSNNLEPKLYEHIRELFGEVDALFIGMECEGAPMSWLYGPMMTIPLSRKNDQSRRLDGSNYEKGIAIVDLLKPKEVYVYAMGQEHWLSFLTSIQYTSESKPIVESDRLVNACKDRGLYAERLLTTKEIML